MNRRQIIFLVLGVIVFHVGIFWFLGGMIRALPPPRYAAPPVTDLRVREAKFDHPETGEALVYREIRVSTKLAFPDVLMEKKHGTSAPALPPTQDEHFISYER